eukprot:scaffold22642_cov57-Phaeocystis_antarctica.AAC.5
MAGVVLWSTPPAGADSDRGQQAGPGCREGRVAAGRQGAGRRLRVPLDGGVREGAHSGGRGLLRARSGDPQAQCHPGEEEGWTRWQKMRHLVNWAFPGSGRLGSCPPSVGTMDACGYRDEMRRASPARGVDCV